jgi:hypothetical protein
LRNKLVLWSGLGFKRRRHTDERKDAEQYEAHGKCSRGLPNRPTRQWREKAVQAASGADQPGDRADRLREIFRYKFEDRSIA